MKSAIELLMTCPEDQIVRMRLVYRSILAGEWKEAAHYLRNAAAEGDADWYCDALALSVYCENHT